MKPDDAPDRQAIAATRDWLEKAVIGLNLCPFAKAPYTSDRIRYVVSNAQTAVALLDKLTDEIDFLMATDPQHCETTLLIHPFVLVDFLDYNDFLDDADALLEDLGCAGEIQVASFHPRYQFDGTETDDVENCTNRSPYPMLHLLREESIARAVASVPDSDAIYQRNIETLRRLGREGWRRLWESPATDPEK